MPQRERILRVRLRSSLPFEEVTEIMQRRAPEFRALSGLRQKYYLHDPATGEFGGLYVWESPEALAEYRESELRASIAAAYQAQGEPDIEVYEVLSILRGEPA